MDRAAPPSRREALRTLVALPGLLPLVTHGGRPPQPAERLVIQIHRELGWTRGHLHRLLHGDDLFWRPSIAAGLRRAGREVRVEFRASAAASADPGPGALLCSSVPRPVADAAGVTLLIPSLPTPVRLSGVLIQPGRQLRSVSLGALHATLFAACGVDPMPPGDRPGATPWAAAFVPIPGVLSRGPARSPRG